MSLVTCRRCYDCDGEEHHWLEASCVDDDGEPCDPHVRAIENVLVAIDSMPPEGLHS